MKYFIIAYLAVGAYCIWVTKNIWIGEMIASVTTDRFGNHRTDNVSLARHIRIAEKLVWFEIVATGVIIAYAIIESLK